MSVSTKQYALMSLTKLSTRFSSVTAEIQRIIDAFGSHLDADLQQRGVEFGQLFRSQAGMRGQLLEPMPVLEREKSLAGSGPAAAPAVRENGGGESVQPGPGQASTGLMDLLGLEDGSSSSSLLTSGGTPAPAPATPTSALDDILGLSLSDSSALPAPGLGLPSLLDIGSSPAGPVTNGGLDSLLNGLDSANYTAGPASSQEVPSLTAYEKHGLKVLFTFPSPSASTTNILLLATNLTSSPIQDFIFQVRLRGEIQGKVLTSSLSPGCSSQDDEDQSGAAVLPHHPCWRPGHPATPGRQQQPSSAQDEAQTELRSGRHSGERPGRGGQLSLNSIQLVLRSSLLQ